MARKFFHQNSFLPISRSYCVMKFTLLVKTKRLIVYFIRRIVWRVVSVILFDRKQVISSITNRLLEETISSSLDRCLVVRFDKHDGWEHDRESQVTRNIAKTTFADRKSHLCTCVRKSARLVIKRFDIRCNRARLFFFRWSLYVNAGLHQPRNVRRKIFGERIFLRARTALRVLRDIEFRDRRANYVLQNRAIQFVRMRSWMQR